MAEKCIDPHLEELRKDLISSNEKILLLITECQNTLESIINDIMEL